MSNERRVRFPPRSILLFCPISPSITLSQVLHSSPRAVRLKSGEQMRNKWVLSETHEGRRYAYQGFSGGLYPRHLCCPEPQLPPLTLPLLPLYLPVLSEECGNAARPGMEGRRKEVKGRGRERMESLTGSLPGPTPSPKPMRIIAIREDTPLP